MNNNLIKKVKELKLQRLIFEYKKIRELKMKCVREQEYENAAKYKDIEVSIMSDIEIWKKYIKVL